MTDFDWRQDRDEWLLEQAADRFERERDFDELHGLRPEDRFARGEP